jgi:hypothetical protein
VRGTSAVQRRQRVRRRNHRKSLTDRIVRAALGTAIPEHRAAIAAEPFTLGIFRTAL